MGPDAGPIRRLGALNAVTGVATVLGARRLSLAASVATPPRLLPLAIRVLGLRQAGQGVLLLLRPEARDLAVVADGLHAASLVPMLLVARWRRFALASGAVTAVSIVLARRA